MHPVVEEVTETIRRRSRHSRRAYIQGCRHTGDNNPPRERLSCGNLAHSYAGCGQDDKQTLKLQGSPNLAIVTAYNDMLSAHQPLQFYPDQIKAAAREFGATAQVAGGVPAMCDGVTQGQPGMELSLFSRDVIAMATAVSLSHNTFDGVLCLGVCDKIVPGLMMGALQFGHLPTGFIPAGPMPSGISNREKAAVRQRYAEGKASRDELLEVESASYHSPGTCTFYGTANSNQMLMELLGVQLPGASFVNPEDPLRPRLTRETVIRVMEATGGGRHPLPLYQVFTEASLVNAIAGLLATGGSTNHCLHLVAMARCAGIDLRWEDFHRLSAAIPLLVRMYPNGEDDVNAFQRAGGMAFLVRELRCAGLLNEDVVSFMGEGLEMAEFAPEPEGEADVRRRHRVTESRLPEVLRPVAEPFDEEGGLRHLQGNLGEAVIKVSAVKAEHRVVEAPCRVFTDQDQVRLAFEAGELTGDLVVVVRGQGPTACRSCTSSRPIWGCCRTGGSRWPWSPTGACPERPARCRRLSTFVRKRRMPGPSPACGTVIG